MAIKLSIDLSDATFAEMAAVIGYAHQLGVDPDEKLTSRAPSSPSNSTAICSRMICS